MGANSGIQWTHHTFNPWRGCTKVSQGCKNCYAEKLSERNHTTLGIWGKNGTRPIAAESYWKQAEKWDRDAKAAGERHRVFCASLADVFEGPDSMPIEAWTDVCNARERLGHLIDATPNLDWLLLTKRPQNVLLFGPLGFRWSRDPMPTNVWIGTSVEDQKTADERIPHLLKIPAAKRFLSCEPLLGAVDLTHVDGDPFKHGSWDCLYGAPNVYLGPDEDGCAIWEVGNQTDERIDWVICGGESGVNARPMHPDWARSLRDQCQAAGVPFFFKQWGEWLPWVHFNDMAIPDDAEISKYKAVVWDEGKWKEHGGSWIDAEDYAFDACHMGQVGVKRAGRLLDGREWSEFPEVAS